MGGPKVPPPSPEELQLRSEQLRLTRIQREQTERAIRLQNLLEPLVLEQLGYRGRYENGQLVSVTEIPPEERDPLYPQRREIEQRLLERTLAGLRGELPVSPGLLTDLARQEETLRETLRRELGTGYEMSTPGIRRLEEFQLRRNQLLEEARRGDITLGEQLQLARQMGNEQLLTARMSRTMAPYQLFGQVGLGFGGNTGSTLASGLQYYLGEREMGMRASAARSEALQQTGVLAGKALMTLASIWNPGLFPLTAAVLKV